MIDFCNWEDDLSIDNYLLNSNYCSKDFIIIKAKNNNV